MNSRSLSLPIWIGSVLCAWSVASCAQPVDDSGWAGQNPGGGSGGALVGGSAGSGTGGSGGTGGAAGGGGSSFGGAAGNTGGTGGNTGGTGGNTGGTGGNTGGTGNSGGSTGGYGNTGGSTGGYGNTGGSTGGYGNSGGSTGGGGGDCLISSGIAACDSCLTSQCYAECAVCSANTDCLDLLDCISYCSGDPTCQDDCSYYYPYGVDDLLALLGSTSGCLALKCATPCQ